MGLDRGECARRIESSSCSGHQSLFVLGRVRSGVGEGIAGFSLSLTLAVAFFLSNASFSGISTPFLAGCSAARCQRARPICLLLLTVRNDERREHWHPPPDGVYHPAECVRAPGT